jgi:Holliday junction resolvase RusA-like endonuclease
MTYEIEIHDLPKLPNNMMYKHWRTKHNEAVKWKKRVLEACLYAKITKLQLHHATLTYERYSSRQPDFDSLVMSFKHVQDGLVEAGVLVDDKPEVIGQPTFKWIKEKQKNAKIRVQIEAA